MTKDCPPVTATIDDTLLLDASAAAHMCDISRSQWYKLVSSGKTPKPVRLGGNVRWSRDELIAWVTAGCPSRTKWECMRVVK